MGFLQAFSGALGGTLADQWKDFYGPMPGVPATAAVFPGAPMGVNNGRGANSKGNDNIITNGSKVIVPEGTALVTIQDGAVTNLITQVGGYEFKSDDPNAKSIFTGDGPMEALVKSSWEKFKFGGAPATNQLLFYVNLKEIPNNRFGTQSEIYWDDAFFGTQVGAVTRGTYTLRVIDPILFIKNFVPVRYLISDAEAFDFQDMDNDAAEQLFNEVVGSLSAAFSKYTNDPSMGNRMSKIQGDQIGFAQSLSAAVEEGYQWKTSRGLEIIKTAILSIEYDEDTKALMSDVKKADALSGSRGNAFFQQAAARGMQSAGENGGGANMAFMGMGMNAAGSMMTGMQQPQGPNSYQPNFGAQAGEPNQQAPGQQSVNQQPQAQPQPQGAGQAAVDPTAKLIEMKKLLDAGVITQEEFNKIKFDLLGL